MKCYSWSLSFWALKFPRFMQMVREARARNFGVIESEGGLTLQPHSVLTQLGVSGALCEGQNAEHTPRSLFAMIVASPSFGRDSRSTHRLCEDWSVGETPFAKRIKF